MTVLVTGATGFVGSAVVRRLLDRGMPVRVLVRPASDRRNIADLPVEVAEGDLREPAGLAPALAGCQALLHVAADYRLWTRDPGEVYRTNVEGTLSLLGAAKDAFGHKKSMLEVAAKLHLADWSSSPSMPARVQEADAQAGVAEHRKPLPKKLGKAGK